MLTNKEIKIGEESHLYRLPELSLFLTTTF